VTGGGDLLRGPKHDQFSPNHVVNPLGSPFATVHLNFPRVGIYHMCIDVAVLTLDFSNPLTMSAAAPAPLDVTPATNGVTSEAPVTTNNAGNAEDATPPAGQNLDGAPEGVGCKVCAAPISIHASCPHNPIAPHFLFLARIAQHR
jgi:hypothetical protein